MTFRFSNALDATWPRAILPAAIVIQSRFKIFNSPVARRRGIVVWRFIILVTLVALGSRVSLLGAGPSYVFIDLGTLGGTLSNANGTNSTGQVCGFSTRPDGSYHVFLSAPNGGALKDLGQFGGTNSYGRAVNDSGQVVGYSYPPSEDSVVGFISAPNGGALQALGSLGGNLTLAYAINNNGQVTGQSSLPGTSPPISHGFLTAPDGGAFSDLGPLPGGTSSSANAVNSNGQVTGSADLSGGFMDAFLSGPNGALPLKDLGRFGGTYSVPGAINASGQVTGYSGLPGNIPSHAFITGANGTPLTDIGTLGGSLSFGAGINDAGTVVGESSTTQDAATHAFIYTPGAGVRDLNNFNLLGLPAGESLTSATAINNLGEIAGNATTSGGDVHGFILIPMAVQLSGVVSRITHGSAGDFDVNLSLTGSPGIECRSGAVVGNFTVIFTFTLPLISVGSATVGQGVGSVGSSAIDASDPHNYIVNLTGVTDAQTITIQLGHVANLGGQVNQIGVGMGVLLGDANGDGFVNIGDTAQVRSQAGGSIMSSNFRCDVNADGLINIGDTIIVKNHSGNGLSATPLLTPRVPVKIVPGKSEDAKTITSIITTGPVRRMGLTEGDKVFGIIKATEVAVDKQ